MPITKDALHKAFEENDPRPLAELDITELEKLQLAEEILEARFQAKKRSRLGMLGQMLVGYVALAGFFANAYQNYVNKQHLQKQQEEEKTRWQQEFERSRRSDKYRSFFETSALATDASSRDKRLIGYALMEEFVADPDYHRKAITILDQALARELAESAKEPPQEGISEEHRAAIGQIVQAMSTSSSCRELEHAASSIDRIVSHAKVADLTETRELFSIYSRRLVGRAALICKTEADFRSVRDPIRDALEKVPDVEALRKNASDVESSVGTAHLLIDTCIEELEEFGGQECVDIRTRYQAFCKEMQKKASIWKLEHAACDLVQSWPAPPPDNPPQAAVPQAE